MSEYKRQPTGKLIDCPGQAHSNPHIDHCLLCAPRWGKIAELAPVNMTLARQEGLDVRVNDLDSVDLERASLLVKNGVAHWASVTKKRTMYQVLRWGASPKKIKGAV